MPHILVTIFLVLGSIWSVPEARAADLATIRIADHYPVNHIIPTAVTRPWIALAEQRSGGTIKFQHFPAQQLVKQTDAVAALQRRIVDIDLIQPGLFPTEFPLVGVTLLPGGYASIVEGGRATARLMAHPAIRQEFERAGVVPILDIPIDGFEIFSRDKPINGPDDVRGLRLRTGGEGQVLAARALGATPVTIAVTEVYTAIQRGTLDGSLFPYSVARSYRLGEVTKFATIGANTSLVWVIYCANTAFWNAAPSPRREALRRAADEILPKGWAAMDAATQSTIEAYRQAGMTLVRVEDMPGGRAAWEKALEAVREKWVADTEAKGLPGRAVLTAWSDALRAARQ